jgi:hypothetical protein
LQERDRRVKSHGAVLRTLHWKKDNGACSYRGQ